jgi:hypothetical protein
VARRVHANGAVCVCTFTLVVGWQSRLEEIAADNQKYLELKAEYEREKQIRHVPVREGPGHRTRYSPPPSHPGAASTLPRPFPRSDTSSAPMPTPTPSHPSPFSRRLTCFCLSLCCCALSCVVRTLCVFGRCFARAAT